MGITSCLCNRLLVQHSASLFSLLGVFAQGVQIGSLLSSSSSQPATNQEGHTGVWGQVSLETCRGTKPSPSVFVFSEFLHNQELFYIPQV